MPDSALAREATELVQDISTRLPFDHSRRVFLTTFGTMNTDILEATVPGYVLCDYIQNSRFES
jgi:hypothetical protein